MFERYLSDALTTHFGDFVENLDADKVRISAWNGELVLKDLYLRRDSLEKVLGKECPVEIEYGKVGNLELRIPWSTVRSQLRWSNTAPLSNLGCTILLSDVNILITPKRQVDPTRTDLDHIDHDGGLPNESLLSLEERRKRKERRVQRKTDAALFRQVAEKLQSPDTPASLSRRWEWVRRLAANLVSSLGVTMQNIHVRYEDPGSCLGFVWSDRQSTTGRYSFAIGITLRRFSLQTADRSEAEDIKVEASDLSQEPVSGYLVRKKDAAAYQLAVYWDRGCQLMALDAPDSDQAKHLLSSRFDSLLDEGDNQHCHLLHPVSPSLQLSLVTPIAKDARIATGSNDESPQNPLDSAPPSSVTMSFPRCHFEIGKYTLEDAAYLRKSLEIWKQTRKGLLPHDTLHILRKIRPAMSATHDPKAWWLYAFKATTILLKTGRGEEIGGIDQQLLRRKRGWLGLAQALVARRQYTDLYVAFLTENDEEKKMEDHSRLLEMEDNLTDDEIVAFRMVLHRSSPFKKVGHEVPSKRKPLQEAQQASSSGSADETPSAGMEELTLSTAVEQRHVRFEEMAQIMHQEIAENSPISGTTVSVTGPANCNGDLVIWKTDLSCPELSLQLNEKSSLLPPHRSSGVAGHRTRAIVKISCALQQKQALKFSGAWEVDCIMASLGVKDLTPDGSEASTPSYGDHLFPHLVNTADGVDSSFVLIGGLKHRLSASANVRREFTQQGNVTGSTTSTCIRLYPLEMVYSTNPLAALARIFSSVRAPELGDDYHRLMALALRWREKQKRRLVQALAHRRKKIFVDVDVAAPVVLIPEDLRNRDSPMLVVDLGRLKLSNDETRNLPDFDDNWVISLSEVQLKTLPSALYRPSTISDESFSRSREASLHQLIEPFSLRFRVSSRFACEKSSSDSIARWKIRISAVLPRLVVNLASSTVRLVKRLQQRWRKRQISADARDVDESFPHFLASQNGHARPVSDLSTSERSVDFQFSAPFIALKLENDVDGRDAYLGSSEITPVVDLAFSGISGIYEQQVDAVGTWLTTFDAKLRSVQAIDLYQRAGKGYSHLLSSFVPDLSRRPSVDEKFFGDLQNQIDTDLVSITFVSRPTDAGALGAESCVVHAWSIKFNELYVEWNPETIAAIQNSIRLPPGDGDEKRDSGDHVDRGSIAVADSDDEFYDAVAFEGSDSSTMSLEGEDHFPLISEISSSLASFCEATEFPTERLELGWNFLNPSQSFLNTADATTPLPTYAIGLGSTGLSFPEDEPGQQLMSREVQVQFKLSKLRVNFNKESRCRRVCTAEMEYTAVNYSSKSDGSSTTTSRIGNLCITDPSSSDSSTLYGEILGLKTDSGTQSSSGATSVLQLELKTNAKKRSIFAKDEGSIDDDGQTTAATKGVDVDVANGTIVGCDSALILRFSPMRFVYLQQLWFEIVDYFFEGIIGYDVWGRVRPRIRLLPDEEGMCPLSNRGEGQSLESHIEGALGDEVGFTSFQITMEAPTVVLPVTYCSPQYLRLDFSTLDVRNNYTGLVMPGCDSKERVQWFNNCAITLGDLIISSWQGIHLTPTSSKDPRCEATQLSIARLVLNWPVGPGASSVKPKWKITSELDSLNIRLRKVDYALLQNVISRNIAEPSRHLEEWNAFQKLPASDLEKYKRSIMVHFGYDKKDVKPTTYSIGVRVPLLSFALIDSDSSDTRCARSLCSHVEWTMRKGVDFILKQQVTCDIALNGSHDGANLLLPDGRCSDRDSIEAGGGSMLSYKSTTSPTGDNVKSLEISEGSILLVYPAWIRIKEFFTSIEEPEVLHPDQIRQLIQIGDRWYPIGRAKKTDDATALGVEGSSLVGDVSSVPPPNQPGSYQFRLLLTSPRIVLSDSEKEGICTSLTLRMSHLDFLHRRETANMREIKTFFVDGVEIYTSSGDKSEYETEHSLIHPWHIAGMIRLSRSGTRENRQDHTTRIKADLMRARAAYSDMSKAIGVGLHLISEIRGLSAARDSEKGSNSMRNDVPADISEEPPLRRPKSMSIGCNGLELTMVDDSLRHFARPQELISLRIGTINYIHLDDQRLECDEASQEAERGVLLHTNWLRLCQIDLIDCLQSVGSPFRLAVSSRVVDGNTLDNHCGWSPVSNTCSNAMTWSDFSSTIEVWGYTASNTLHATLDSLDGTLTQSNGMEAVDQGLLELRISVDGTYRQIEARLRSCKLQWNPSTVIAVQRFLGRLLKEARSKAAGSLTHIQSTAPSDSAIPDDLVAKGKVHLPVRATCTFDDITICLNKEHQNRMLLRIELLGSEISFAADHDGGRTLSGSVRDLGVWDADNYERLSRSMIPLNRNCFCVLRESGSERDDDRFFKFNFKTFSSRDHVQPEMLPVWVDSVSDSVSAARHGKSIDDYLSITVSSFRVNYIRERTEEVIDYLSNGLPGKGMGATSKAAKGFINRRIQTKSFLDLSINTPQLLIPRNEGAHFGLIMRLGDVDVRSWFEAGKDTMNAHPTTGTVWSRALSLSLQGMEWHTYGTSGTDSIVEEGSCMVPVDLSLNIRKPRTEQRAMSINGNLSSVEMTLEYSSYALIRAVLRDNVGRTIQDGLWDNVEKAYWTQATATEIDKDKPMVETKTSVAYSSSARLIRYGRHIPEVDRAAAEAIRPNNATVRSKTEIEIVFDLASVAIKLRRDDQLESKDASVNETLVDMLAYDMILLHVDKIHLSAGKNRDGDTSLHLSLFRIGLFDLGDTGRRTRELFYQNLVAGPESTQAGRQPSAFVVIAEGRSPEGVEDVSTPQLLVTVDTCPSSSVGMVGESNDVAANCDRVTVARIVINDLTVNAMFRPLQEAAAYLRCSWSTQHLVAEVRHSTGPNEHNSSWTETQDDAATGDKESKHIDTTSFQIKLVAHYPHVFFVADESDANSRALVLRGLAIVNGSIIRQVESIPFRGLVFGDEERMLTDTTVVSAVDAQWHSMESYINPGVERVLGLKPHHAEVLGDYFDPVRSDAFEVSMNPLIDTGLGVALIEPVTFGIQFAESRRDLFPSRRTLSVSMEPVSTILSFEDIGLLEAVLERWHMKRPEEPVVADVNITKVTCPPTTTFTKPTNETGNQVKFATVTRSFEVTFKSRRLGLVLKKVANDVVVDSVTHVSDEVHRVQIGDILKAVNSASVDGQTLERVVGLLSTSSRPIRLTFSRQAFDFTVVRDSFSQTDSKPNPNHASSSESSFTSTLQMGMPSGLQIEQHPCGNVPVLTDINPEMFARARMRDLKEATRCPRPGSVVTYIDATPCMRLGYEESVGTLHHFETPGIPTMEREGDSGINDLTYTVTFVEIESSLWGSVDDVVLFISRLDLTFIDDLNGKNMPVLRGRMDSIDVRMERGIGLEANLIETVPPFFFVLGRDESYPDESGSDSSSLAVVQKVGALTHVEIDYYHPQIASWEPFLEPSQLCFGLERQRGNAFIPGRLAVEVSDRFLHTQRDRYDNLSRKTDPTGIVSVNLTEKSAEVFFRALREWKVWRQGDIEVAVDKEDDRANESSASRKSVDPQSLFMREPIDSAPTKPKHAHESHSSSDRSEVASRAAQVALSFATRHGAGTRIEVGKGTPYLFRNRSGLRISFEQQTALGQGERTEVFEGCETRFRMEPASQAMASLPEQSIDGEKRIQTPQQNRVRSYEGQYPSLTVSIDAVAGVRIEPLQNLPTFKVGRSTHFLLVTKLSFDAREESMLAETEIESSHPVIEFRVPVVWTVELQDNQRILTLSSAAQLLFAGEDANFDIGTRLADASIPGEAIEVLTTNFQSGEEGPIAEERSIDFRGVVRATMEDAENISDVRNIGVARPGVPFFLPLWLALGRELSFIYIRPSAGKAEAKYEWSRQEILRLQPFDTLPSKKASHDMSHVITWAWAPISRSPRLLACHRTVRNDGINDYADTLWLSCYSATKSALIAGLPENDQSSNGDSTQEGKRADKKRDPDSFQEVSLVFEAPLSFRNLLPIPIRWEIAELQDSHFHFLGGSSVETQSSELSSGCNVDILSCNFMEMDTHLRMGLHGSWSEWTRLPLVKALARRKNDLHENEQRVDAEFAPSQVARQVNIQLLDDFGVPMTVGFRIIPKLCKVTDGSLVAYGIDVVAHAELWLRNLTSLPLVFGCVASQIDHSGREAVLGDAGKSDSTAIVSAEAAISEMASVFEFGDKGKRFRGAGDDAREAPDAIQILPFQVSKVMYHEVFEYIEVEHSVVKRRWWGSETYNTWRQDPASTVPLDQSWQWLDDSWRIDCSGEAKASEGGWESCSSLYGGKKQTFSGQRLFNPVHSFRRRRWIRRMASKAGTRQGSVVGGINAFHQPVRDSFTRAQALADKTTKNRKHDAIGSVDAPMASLVDSSMVQISLRCGDGTWSRPCLIPMSGNTHGVARVFASRWPVLTKTSRIPSKYLSEKTIFPTSHEESLSPEYTTVNLSPQLFELCYRVLDLEGEWGDFSRICLLTPRFMIRNDSTTNTLEVKQTGAPNDSAMLLQPGDSKPFYWADFRLPELVSLRPSAGPYGRPYKWSGGLDIGRLGMTAIRVRTSQPHFGESHGDGAKSGVQEHAPSTAPVKAMRSLVEIRSGTGGFGINVSFREENSSGNGSLFRIENLSPFPIWLAQDGVLANPGIGEAQRLQGEGLTWDDVHPESEGDCLGPASCTAFALDVPYRQGKYAHRQAADMPELLRVRVALAPLHCREGIETTKLVGLSEVGESVRLNPSKLVRTIGTELGGAMTNVRVLGVVATDGPTRVLRFCLMKKEIPSDILLGRSSKHVAEVDSSLQRDKLAIKAALEASSMLSNGQVLGELEAKRMACFGRMDELSRFGQDRNEKKRVDQVFSLRASFTGFTCSFVDSTPSEISVTTLKNVNALARWNAERTTDGSLVVSVGWLQVDNHVPNAPFPVAISPDGQEDGCEDEKQDVDVSPLLLVGLTFAPRHTSGILCLRSVTIAPRNLAIAVDLAFIVRLQRFLAGLNECASQSKPGSGLADASSWHESEYSQRTSILLPNIDAIADDMERASSAGLSSRKIYFEGFTVLPCNVSLSVAPARALTPSQVSLEGPEAAAIHTAVRKGDLRIGSGTLGVRVGRKNKTALAVVRGLFKSIVVDALLRCDGASLSFQGLFLRNHFSTWPQLRTYLGAHYLSSLRNNLPALLASLSAFGNPLGLIRGIGDGMNDFVIEPVKGLKRSMQELDPFFVVDGVARGTGSLARHAVGGFAFSASMLTETFSKNMAVLTLDRRYAQRRDRGDTWRDPEASITLVEGMESGVAKLVRGILEGVTGVIRAPIRGAEKKGVEGFAKGIGKGLLGLLVKPVIGLSDAATDVMIGVKGSIEGGRSGIQRGVRRHQIRPRRPLYGWDRILRPYDPADAAAAALMLRTRLAGEFYLSHCDMGDSVALLSVRRMLLLDQEGNERLVVKFNHIKSAEVHPTTNEDDSDSWSIVIVLNVPRLNGSEVEVVTCQDERLAKELRDQINQGIASVAADAS